MKHNEKIVSFVTCRLKGPSTLNSIHNFGLANQMFQIATASSYAVDNNLTAKFPELRKKKFGGYINNIFNKLSTKDIEEIEFEYFEPGFNFSNIPSFKNIRINGYFQSELYFIKNKKYITNLFAPSLEDIEYINRKYGWYLENSISCHIRLGDYKFLESHHPNLLEQGYYQKALNYFDYHKKNVLIFSDDIEHCKKLEQFNKPNFYFIENEPDYMDMYIMSMCQNNIIANSTFSWWGAWLNSNKNKTVVSPKNWFGKAKNYNTESLIPVDWIRI